MEAFAIHQDTHTLHLTEWERHNPHLLAGFTLRTGGESQAPYTGQNMGLHVGDIPQAVVSNRRQLSERLGFPFDAFTCGDQVHGITVQRVTADSRGAGRASLDDVVACTDGLHTNEPGVLLASFYADCVPLFFLDKGRKAVGVAHAGWKGTVGRISGEMIEAFHKEYSSKPEDLLIAIGPSIGVCCYEVDDRIIDEVRKSTGHWEQAVTAKQNGKYMLDLPLLNQLIFSDFGIKPEQITRTGYCTGCRTDLFFSHRKEGGKTGRMASFIGWRE
ncbi:peptidoglycan editing factor PgeF [Brevibacillus dissolubilis]|uniref:peptidoglycan editing factor PgeF n=1 Tax=Brevibacillus dissolubilis TaxID=1844116 RepID=UPI0011172CF4|nr:peptidoglycan editing factor PgeF [Brevibacillus dissolubilis]